MRQIFPPGAAGAEITLPARGETEPAAEAAVRALAELYAYPGPQARAEPWLRANMVTSVDGGATLAGLSGGLSGQADRLVFTVLRSLADVVLVGAGTARAERYRPAGGPNIWAALRDGRAPAPPIAVITRGLDLDLDGPLLTGASPESPTIVLTTAAAPADRRAAAARHAEVVVAGADRLTAAAVVGALAERGYRRLLAEGGPSLLAQITAAGLLDDLCLTISPVLEGGAAGRIMAAGPASPDRAGPGQAAETGSGQAGAGAGHAGTGPPTGLRLAHVIEDRGYLLCRYLRNPG